MNGTWTLRVVDKCKPTAITSSTGTLTSWSITFSAPDDIASFSWSPATNLSSTNTALTVTNTASPRTYTVTATTSQGCTGQASVNVLVGCTLPVELTAFKAECLQDEVQLEWEVASQQENDYYTLERSYDGLHFDHLGRVDGGGTTSTPLTYIYKDKDLDWIQAGSAVYYRLSQTDLDGTTKALFVQLAESCHPGGNCLAVYPNPVSSGEFFFEMGSPGGDFLLEVHDMYGKLVLSKKLDQLPGKVRVALPETVSPGIYYLSSRNEKIKFCEQKILVQ